MTDDELKVLYAMIVAYDNRTIGQANMMAWAEQAQRNRWTLDGAREAVHEHYARSDKFLMPSHLNEIIHEKRQQPERYVALPRSTESSRPELLGAVYSQVAAELGWTRKSSKVETDPALAVPCPFCGAAPGRPCTRKITRGLHAGEYKPLRAAHPSRVERVETAAA